MDAESFTSLRWPRNHHGSSYDYAYADWFDTTTGIVEGNCGGAATQCDRARPIAGAHLALVCAICCSFSMCQLPIITITHSWQSRKAKGALAQLVDPFTEQVITKSYSQRWMHLLDNGTSIEGKSGVNAASVSAYSDEFSVHQSIVDLCSYYGNYAARCNTGLRQPRAL